MINCCTKHGQIYKFITHIDWFCANIFYIKLVSKKNSKQVEYENIGTKSVNMSDIMVYLAMFSTTIDQILCFWVLMRWKWVIILLVFGTLWNLGLFWFPRTPPIWTNSQVLLLFRLESFPYFGYLTMLAELHTRPCTGPSRWTGKSTATDW